MITTALSWGAALVKIASALTSDEKDKKDLDETGNRLGWFADASRSFKSGSIQQSANRSLISPMVVFEESLMYQDYMDDLMTIVNLRDIRDALTHLTLEGSVGGVKIARLVDQINPNRAAGFMSLKGAEAFNKLNTSILNTDQKKDNKDDKDNKKDKKDKKDKPDDNYEPPINIDSAELRNLTEYQPLALGRTVKANTIIDGREVSFFLTFRQIPVPAKTADIELMFSATKQQEGWAARMKEYAAGGVTRPELLKGTDIIKREFNIRSKEMSGYYNEAMDRETMNIRSSLRTGIISMNTLANTVIITKETANKIEYNLAMRFDSQNIKRLRKAMNANTIVIVNDARGVFEFHTVGDNLPVKYTLQQIRQKSKKEDTGSLEALIKLLSGR